MVYKQDEQFISWLNGLYPGRMVEAVTTFARVAAYQVNHAACTTFAVFKKRFGEILLKWLHTTSFILACFYNRKTYM